MATLTPITGAPTLAPANLTRPDALNRRVVLGMAAAVASVAAMPIAAPARSTWDAEGWLTRWGGLGCGVRRDAHGHLQLAPRSGVEARAGAMLAELAPPGRLQALTALLGRIDRGGDCPASIAVQHMHAVNAECPADDDPALHDAWFERWAAARRRLCHSPARTARGLAAKLREGIECIGSPDGDAIVASALAQLERWS